MFLATAGIVQSEKHLLGQSSKLEFLVLSITCPVRLHALKVRCRVNVKQIDPVAI